MKNGKNLKISNNAHDILKKYCEKNFLKMNEWASYVIIDHINKLENNNGTKNTMEKKMSKV